MRILQVCPHFYRGGAGGIVEYVKNISERLAEKHDVTVFATDPRKNFPRFEVINGVKVERFRRLAPGNAYFFSLDMILRLKNSEFDVVHGHGYHSLPLHFSHVAKYKKFVVSTHFHGVGHSAFRDSLIKIFKPIGELTLKKADKIIAVSQHEKSLLLKEFKIHPEKVAVVPCGINFEEFKNLRRRKRSYRSILYVGRLDWYKGVHYLVEVLPRLHNDVVLEIVGKGSLRRFLEERAKKLGIFDRVKFYEDLPRKELLQKYADADVFVLLSRYEAYSLVVAEALAAGTPCIVANTSGLSEWIDNVNCFGIPFPIALDKLTELIKIVLDRKACGRVLKNLRSKKILSLEEVVKLLEKVYANNGFAN